MSREQRATTSYLFQVCRQHFSEPVARVASEGALLVAMRPVQAPWT